LGKGELVTPLDREGRIPLRRKKRIRLKRYEMKRQPPRVRKKFYDEKKSLNLLVWTLKENESQSPIFLRKGVIFLLLGRGGRPFFTEDFQ